MRFKLPHPAKIIDDREVIGYPITPVADYRNLTCRYCGASWQPHFSVIHAARENGYLVPVSADCRACPRAGEEPVALAANLVTEAPASRAESRKALTANWRAPCQNCDLDVQPGDPIARVASGGVVHEARRRG